MQCLSSPTRNEIDKAHSQGIWLDIGVPSFRNLRRLSTIRTVLWWLLAISSVPLHLLYNSAVFSSLCSRRYNVFWASSEFLDGAPFNASTMEYLSTFLYDPGRPRINVTNVLQDYKNNQTSLVKLENKECVGVYEAQVVSANSDLILVSTYSNSTDSLLYYELGQDSHPTIFGSYPQPPCFLSCLSFPYSHTACSMRLDKKIWSPIPLFLSPFLRIRCEPISEFPFLSNPLLVISCLLNKTYTDLISYPSFHEYSTAKFNIRVIFGCSVLRAASQLAWPMLVVVLKALTATSGKCPGYSSGQR